MIKALWILLFVSYPLMAQSKATTIEVKYNSIGRGDISKVEMLSHKSLEDGSTEITFSLNAIASACEDFTYLESFGGQTSLSDSLNPTDLRYRIRTNWKKGCATGSFGDQQEFTFTRKYSSGLLGSIGVVYHLSFDAGMMGGFDR
jgi:hypothetical protein